VAPIPASHGDGPYIVADGRLWVCRSRTTARWGYGTTPTHALLEWRRMNAGKPADAAQEALPTTPRTASRGMNEDRHV
jgi:hypothetical protein